MKIKSWDSNNINDGTNYDAVPNANFQGLPSVKAVMLKRHGNWPVLGGIERPGRELNLDIYIRSGSSLELAQWFDPDDETAKRLIVEDSGGGNDRFVNAICTEFREVPFSAGLQYAVSVQVDGDMRWREIAETNESFLNITSPAVMNITNNGEDYAYPRFEIKPETNKTNSWSYKRFTAVRWLIPLAAENYPVDIVNNSLDTQIASTNHALANGNDTRVWVNGLEVDRWLDGPDTASTEVWCNLDFQADIELTLTTTIVAGSTEITADESIANLPNEGIINIGAEIITYTSKNNTTRTFSGLTRGAKGTTAVGHSATARIYWIQHDISILYGNAAAGSPPADSDLQPAFALAGSSNTIWNYDDFGADNGKRSASWAFSSIAGALIYFYSGNQNSNADPWAEIGMASPLVGESGRVSIENPCYITDADFQNGEYYTPDHTVDIAKIQSYNPITGNWTDEDDITLGTSDAWTAWSDDQAIDASSSKVAIYLQSNVLSNSALECADVILDLDSTRTPITVLGAEESNYQLDCTITNDESQSIRIVFNMELNETLKIDTYDKTIIYDFDGTNQFRALTIIEGIRRDWLPVKTGANSLDYAETGSGQLDIEAYWYERYYE